VILVEVKSVFSRVFRTFCLVAALSLLFMVPVFGQDGADNAAAKLLPEKLGDYRASGALELQTNPALHELVEREGSISSAGRIYVSKDGERFSVALVTTASDAAAYAQLTQNRKLLESSKSTAQTNIVDVGTAGFSFSDDAVNNSVEFFKGCVFVVVRTENKSALQHLTSFSKNLSDTLDKGAGEIPVLVKHLPGWQDDLPVLYAVDKDSLQREFSNQPALEAVSFTGGAEAAAADYGSQKLVVVEFNTASLATDNDQRIKAKLQELNAQGQPAPAYRRVGNYAVFVFGAPSQEAANQLIDQVKYQQVVQWLGQNPFSYEQATREFTETTLGVFVSVVKTSGLALVSCLAIGGLFGALLFRSRRAQQRAREAYADSDAMLRLNLDELTPESDAQRLLESVNSKS
jgi:muconolactone delta-isomerase